MLKSANLVKLDEALVAEAVEARDYCTSSKKSYVSVTCSMTFSSLSLSHSPATNLIGQARESDQRRRVTPSRSCCTTVGWAEAFEGFGFVEELARHASILLPRPRFGRHSGHGRPHTGSGLTAIFVPSSMAV